MNKLYKVIEEKVIASPNNKKHQLVDAKIKTPEGKETVWQYIKSRDVVSILAISENNEIYCVKQWRPARKDYIWELPAGGIEIENPTKEQIFENANRELQEEIGLKANTMELLATFTPSIHMTSKYYAVLGKNLEKNPLPKDEDEELEVKLIPFSEAYDLLIKKQVPSSMTLVGIELAKASLGLS